MDRLLAGLPEPPDDEERRIDCERMLMEADRMTMQMVQTSLSLIGFGFSINTFFDTVSNRAIAPNGGQGARILGAALLVVGLQLLIAGTWTQAKYRRELRRRYAAMSPALAVWVLQEARFTPSYVSALLLMIVGVVALAWVLIHSVF